MGAGHILCIQSNKILAASAYFNDMRAQSAVNLHMPARAYRRMHPIGNSATFKRLVWEGLKISGHKGISGRLIGSRIPLIHIRFKPFLKISLVSKITLLNTLAPQPLQHLLDTS